MRDSINNFNAKIPKLSDFYDAENMISTTNSRAVTMNTRYFILITLCTSILIIPLLTASNRSDFALFFTLGVAQISLACFFIKKIQQKFWSIIPLAFLFSTLSTILFVSLIGNLTEFNYDIVRESQAMALWKYFYLGFFGIIPCAHVIINIQQYLKDKRYFFMALHIITGLYFCFLAVMYWLTNYPI